MDLKLIVIFLVLVLPECKSIILPHLEKKRGAPFVLFIRTDPPAITTTKTYHFCREDRDPFLDLYYRHEFSHFRDLLCNFYDHPQPPSWEHEALKAAPPATTQAPSPTKAAPSTTTTKTTTMTTTPTTTTTTQPPTTTTSAKTTTTTSTPQPWSVCHCPNNSCTARGGCENGAPCESGWNGPFCQYVCDPGTWGQGCVNNCHPNCQNGTCDPKSGLCDVGCIAGYKLPDCSQECPMGTWGINCSNLCFDNCVDQSCDHINGQCTKGCLVGYKMHHCLTFCDDGTWGINCSNICSDHCVNGQCDTVSGQCRDGCEPGYTSPFCNQSCLEGTYGQDCGQNCSHSCIPSNTSGLPSCHSVDGTCLLGCQDGYLGPKCGDFKAPVVATSIQRLTNSAHVITIVSVAVSAALLAIIVTAVVVVLYLKRLARKELYIVSGEFSRASSTTKLITSIENKHQGNDLMSSIARNELDTTLCEWTVVI